MIWKLHPHPSSVAREVWLFEDSAIAAYFMKTTQGEGSTLSLARHFIFNELRCNFEYQGIRESFYYYKSSRSEPIDLIHNDIGIKIGASNSQLGWQSRALIHAQKKLKLKNIALVLPTDSSHFEKNDVSQLSWAYWS